MGENQVALVALAILTVVQAAAWLVGDQRMATSGSSIESATQLGGPGVRSVRLLEPPHTGGNYLTREMVFIVARRRSRQIRILAIASIGIVPLVLLALPIDGAWVRPVCLVMHAGGAIMSRWLFSPKPNMSSDCITDDRLPWPDSLPSSASARIKPDPLHDVDGTPSPWRRCRILIALGRIERFDTGHARAIELAR